MNTTAAIFFLALGQANGGIDTAGYPGAGMVLIPSHYASQIECEAAGEAARANNQGLSFLSYTCVPGTVNVEAERLAPTGNYFTHERASFGAITVVKAVQSLGPKCDDVCELIEVTE